MIVNNNVVVSYSPSDLLDMFLRSLPFDIALECIELIDDLHLTPYISEGDDAVRKRREYIKSLSLIEHVFPNHDFPRIGQPYWIQPKPSFDAFLQYEQLDLFDNAVC